MAINSNSRFKLFNIIPISLLALLLFSLLPNHVLVSISAMNDGSDIDLSPLSSSSPTVFVDRLLTRKDVYNSQSSEVLSSELSFTNASNPNFAIGSQLGPGGGSITIRDSFNWTGTESLNTTNQYNASEMPSIRTDTITITNSTGFNRNEASFNITDVVSESDKRAIEEFGDPLLPFFTSRSPGEITDYRSEIAMSFTIQEEYANLSKVRTYTDAIGSATGTIYIVNSTSNVPDDTLQLSSQENIISSGGDPLWHEYTFNNPVLLRGGITYFVIMNETSSNDLNDFWKWHAVADASGRNDGSVYYKYDTHTSNSWNLQPGQDLPLEIEVLPVEYNGTAYVAKTYTDPTDVSFSYNNSVDDTELSAFWFNWNDTETHTFQTNTSVSFNLAFIANYTSSSNPLSGATSYFVQNATSSLWNVSFSTSAANTTFSVADRTLAIQGLANDWDSSAIFHGSTLVYNTTNSGGLNGSVTYITNSDTMTIHASTLSAAKAWNISFTALNYLLDFSLSQGGSSLELPYQANVTDVLDLIFSVQTTGNTSYWIDFPNGSQVRKATNINTTHTNFGEDWDINASVDQTANINGTYDLQAFWISNDKTKVGTFTRELAVFVNTSFSVIADAKVVIDQLFNVSTYYQSIHNSTDVKNAKIWCEANWTTDRYMTQNQTDYSYNASFSTVGQQAGDVGNLTIITQLYWFVNWTTTIFIKFIEDASLSANMSDVTFEWRKNATLRIHYNDTSGNPIEGATITVDGTSAFNISNTYYFRLNTTDYTGVGYFPNLTINASHVNYVSRAITFNLTIVPGETSISGSGEGQNLDNITVGLSKTYANSTADSLTINLRYFYILANDSLNANIPDIVSQIPYSVPVKESNLTWTIEFFPNKTGNFLINFTFSSTNYKSCTFIFNLTVTKSATVVFSEIGTSETVYHNESMDFFILYNNTNYNENITGLTEGAGITLNSTKISFLNRTGNYYWFRLSPTTLPLGLHSTNITFYHAYFETSSIIISFNVITRPTGITGQYNSQPLVNDTTIVNLYFANSSADAVIINLEYYDILTTSSLNNGVPTIETPIPIIGTVKEGNLSWTITFNPNQTGSFLINITFSLTNYANALFIFHLMINRAPSNINNSLLSDLQVFYNEYEDFYLIFNNSYYNENVTGLTEGSGINLNNSKIAFLNRTGNLYWFRVSPTVLPLGFHTTNITFSHVYFEPSSIIISFDVITRPTGITGQYNSQPLVNDTTIVNQYFANSSADTVVINLEYYDILTTNTLDTSAPTVETLISIIGTVKEGNLSWTITFNPNQTGVFLINITFSLTNYTTILFIFHLIIEKAETNIYNSLSPDPTIFYTQSFDFFLLYNNTYYNENITGLTEGAGINLNNTKVSFLNRTGEYYWFRLSPITLPLGFHSTNITFTHVYFEASSIIISFEVLARLTSITGEQNSQPLVNDTTIVTQYFANSSADSVRINLDYYDVLTTNTLDTSTPTIETCIPIVGTVKEGNLSWTITFNPNQTGSFLINITFLLANYTTALFIFHLTVNSAETAIYSSLMSDPTVYYTLNLDFFLLYNNTNYNENITGLTEGIGITLNNTKISFLNRTGEYYWFRLSPTTLSLGTHGTNITFDNAYFESSSTIISFDVIARPTDITGQHKSQSLTNDTTIVNQYFATSSADAVIINLEYYDILSTNSLDTNTPSIETLIPIIGTVKEGNLSWTITFNPNQTGSFLINVTFTLTNYTTALFIFHLAVKKAETTIYNSLSPDPTTYYNVSLDFFLLYNNTNYNENITGLTEGTGITLNNTKASFLNRTGEYYWFRLSPTTLPLGTHGINITFYDSYFQSSSLFVNFNVIDHLSNITGHYGGQLLFNDTTVISQYFSNGSLDTIEINLEYHSRLTGTVLNTDNPVVISPILINGMIEETNHSWTITFNPNQTGVFLITITFSLTNYTDALFIFHLTVNNTLTDISSELLVEPLVYYKENLDFFLLYINTIYNENITGLTEGSGIALNNTKIGFLNRTGEYYWFRLSPTTIPLGLHATNITFTHAYFETSAITVNFTVITRPTNILGQYSSQSLDNDTTTVNQFFANSSADVVVINLEYYDGLTTNALDTNVPTIKTFIPIIGAVKEGNLSWTITFNPNQTGSYLINITFLLANYTTALFIFHLTVNSAETAIYSSLMSDPTVYYTLNLDFYFLYNNTHYNENITGLTEGSGIVLNNTEIGFLNRTGEYYWFRLSPTTIPLGLHATNITFSQPYYESSSLIVSFEVLIHPTSITSHYGGQTLLNDTTVITQYFSNSTVDAVEINLDYYSQITGTAFDTDNPIINSPILVNDIVEESNRSWTITFNPNQTGSFLINIIFTLTNYTTSLFIFHLTVYKAETAIYNSLLSDPAIYYDLTLDFFLLYNNTIYNENITGLTEGIGITLNNTKISFLNRTGNYYWFRLSPTTLPLGLHSTNISFAHAYFETSSIIIIFGVTARPTNITGQYNSQTLTNDTTIVNKYFANSSADVVVINLEYYDILTTNILDTTVPIVETHIPIIDSIKEGNLSWTITFDPNQTAVFLINITFSLTNYTTALFIFHLTVNDAESAIYSNLSSDPTVYYKESISFFLLYNNTNYNENITGLTEGAGITLNNTKISFLNRTGEYYWFRLSPTILALGDHTVNITFTYQFFQTSWIIVTFEVLARPTNIAGEYKGSSLLNNTPSVSQFYANSSDDNVIITLEYFDVLTSDILDTNDLTVVSTVPIYSFIKETNLSWTITFNPNQTGLFLINLTYSLANHTTTLFIFHLIVEKAETNIESELLSVPSIYYAENLDFFLLYNNTIYNENITGLTEGAGITLNNTEINFLNQTDEYYWFRLSPIILPLGIHATNITFYHSYYESSSRIISFDVITRPTDITGRQDNQPLVNDTTVVNQYFANSLADVVVINLEYIDGLTTNILDASVPTIETRIPFISAVKEGNLSWTFTFNPNQTGIFVVNLTFTLANYTNALFLFHLTIIKSPTTIYNSLSPDTEVYYNESREFFLLFNNSYYNENISGLIEGSGITLNNTKVSFLNRTDEYYWFRLSPTVLSLGIHTLNITFYHSYFESSSEIIGFVVTPRITHITGQYNSQLLDNDTTVVYQYFANSSADVVVINLAYTDELTTNVLNTSAPTIETRIPIISVVKEGNLLWTFTFDPNQTGVFLINISFSLTNYTNALFLFHLTVNIAETTIYSSLPANPEFSHGTSMDFFLLYINSIYNENITGLSEGAGITINNTKISFLNHTGEQYWFRLSPIVLPLGLHTTNISFNHPYFEFNSSIITFNIFDRSMAIDNSLSNPTNENTIDFLQYGEFYFFNVFLNDSETSNPVNASISSLPLNAEFLGTVGSGNHSFSYNASLIGVFINLSIVFTKPNYESIEYIISFTVSPRIMIPDNDLSISQTIDYLQFGDIFYFNLYLNDSKTGESLNVSGYTQLPINVYFENYSLSHGNLFRYNALNRGILLLSLNFSVPFYATFSYPLNITVSKSESELIASSLAINTYYNQDTEFYVVWEKTPNPMIYTSPSIKITNTSNIEIQPSLAGWSDNILLYQIDNGNYSFIILADQIGSITIFITFYSNDFTPEPYQINISLTILPAPTDFGVTSQTNGSSLGEESAFYYTESREISIQWIENIFGSSIIDINPEFTGDWEGFATFENYFVNGTHLFSINGSKIGLYQLSVLFETPTYSKVEFVILFNISTMPTFEPVIDYQSERIVGQTLTVNIERWINLNNDSVPIREAQLFNRSTSLSFIATTTQEYLLTLTLSTEEFRQGNHNLTLILWSVYGVENQTVNILLHLIGRELSITIKKSPEKLVQGEDFTVIAILQYTPLDTGLGGGGGAGITLSSLEDVPVTFLVEILYKNGTIKSLVYDTVANTTGIAEFLVMGRYTRKADGIQSITVSTGATTSTKAGLQTTPTDFLSLNKFEKSTNLVESLLPLLVGVLFAILIGIATLGRYRWSKKKSSSSRSSEDSTVDVEKETRTLDSFPSSIKAFENEILYLFDFIIKKKVGRWAGKASFGTLSKNLPNTVSKEDLKLVFKTLHEETNYFVLERTVIAITEEGRKVAATFLPESVIKTKTEPPIEKEEVNEGTKWIKDFPSSFSSYEKEIVYLFQEVMKRPKKYQGKISLKDLISHSPVELSNSSLKLLFIDISTQTNYFTRENKSIVITEEGKKIASSILIGDIHE